MGTGDQRQDPPQDYRAARGCFAPAPLFRCRTCHWTFYELPKSKNGCPECGSLEFVDTGEPDDAAFTFTKPFSVPADMKIVSELTYKDATGHEWPGLIKPETDWQQFHRSVAGLLKMLEEQDEKIRFLEMRIGLCDKAETKLHEDLQKHEGDFGWHGYASAKLHELQDRLDQLSYGLGIMEKKQQAVIEKTVRAVVEEMAERGRRANKVSA